MDELKIEMPQGLVVMVTLMLSLLVVVARIAIMLAVCSLFWLYFTLGG